MRLPGTEPQPSNGGFVISLNRNAMDREKALRVAVKKTQKAMSTNPCRESLDNFTAASNTLDEFLTKKIGPGPLEERRFKNLSVVVEYLKGEGWKIGHSKAYTDKKLRKIEAQPDGTFLLSDVERYIIKAELKKADGVDPTTETQTRKAEAEIEKLEAAAELLKLKAKIETGKYVPREQMERELAARAAFLKTDLENFFRSHAAEMITVVDGDQTKTPDLLVFCLKAKADWLDRYAKQKEFLG